MIYPSNDNTPPPGTAPFINLPPATATMIGLFWLVHIGVLFLTTPPVHYEILLHWGFVPARYSETPFTLSALTGLIGYNFLHGSWAHLIINSLMMAAFGKAVESRFGAGYMLMVFFLSSLLAAGAHFALSPTSPDPVIGASGGISGLFAIALLMLYRANGQLTLRRLGGLIGIFILISVAFGWLGPPGGGDEKIAWAAHIGGFVAGITLYFLKPNPKAKDRLPE